MLTKPLNNQNQQDAKEELSSPKDVHKTTNDTTSGDEPNFKSSPPNRGSPTKKEAVKSSQEQDLSAQRQVSPDANGATEPANPAKETPTPSNGKMRLKELRLLAKKPG